MNIWRKYSGSLLIALLVLGALAWGGWLRARLIEKRSIRQPKALGLDGYYYYVSAAETLLAGRGLDPAYNHRGPAPLLYIPPPLQSVFVAAVYWLSGRQNLMDVYFTQLVINLGAGLLAFFILLRWGGRIAALIGLWWWALYPEFIYWNCLVLTENNYYFLLLLTLVGLVQWRKKLSVGWALAGAALIGVSALQRPTGMYLGFALAPYAFWVLRGRRIKWLHAAIFLLVPFLVLTPWMIRNKLKTGDPVWISSNGGILLYSVNHWGYDPLKYPFYIKYPPQQWTLPEINNRIWSKEFEGRRRTYYNLSNLYMAEAKRYVLAHPLHFLKNFVIKTVQRFSLMPDRLVCVYRLGPLGLGLIFYLSLLVGLAGLLGGRKIWRDPAQQVLALCFAYYAWFIGLMPYDEDGRYGLPLRIFLMLLGAMALARAIQWLGAKIRARRTPA